MTRASHTHSRAKEKNTEADPEVPAQAFRLSLGTPGPSAPPPLITNILCFFFKKKKETKSQIDKYDVCTLYIMCPIMRILSQPKQAIS